MLDTKKFINDTPFTTTQESGTAEIEGTPLHSLNSQSLEVYPGANPDENYIRRLDGNRKMKEIISDLQNN